MLQLKEISGNVVRVFGDYVSIAVADEILHLIGIRGTFVKIRTKKGVDLIGIVSNVNLYDELYRQSGGRISLIESYSDIALHRNEVIVSVLGTVKDGKVDRRIEAIPSPGDQVILMTEEELKKIFSVGDIRIGRLTTMENVEVKLDINELASKHLAILAMTGSGKSNTLAVLMIRLLENFKYPRILLIDTHSEYIVLGSKESPIREKVIIYAPIGRFREILEREGLDVKPLEIPYWMLTVDEWFSLLSIPQNATRQRRFLRTALRMVKAPWKVNDPVYFELESLLNVLRDLKADDVIEKIEDARDSEEFQFIFEPEDALNIINSSLDERKKELKIFKIITEPIVQSGLKIIALGGLSADVQNAVVSMILRTMFRIAVEFKLLGTPLTSIIAIEEAHIYTPERSYAIAKSIIERIAKEGRKFGIGLMIVSQRPREISQTVLAQCGTLIALRTVNPLDQKHIRESLEDITTALTSNLPGLGKGEAIVSGPAIAIPSVVKIDLFDDVIEELFGRRMQLGGKDINFREEWNKELSIEIIEKVFDVLRNLRKVDAGKKFKEKKIGTLGDFFK